MTNLRYCRSDKENVTTTWRNMQYEYILQRALAKQCTWYINYQLNPVIRVLNSFFNLIILNGLIITVYKKYSTFLQHFFYIKCFKNLSIENTLAYFEMKKNYLLSRQTENRIPAKKTFFFFVSESKSSIH